MNMNKALQNLYHAVSGSTTTKVNISKLLVDIHYAITGKESENKNNWSKIINSMADNWPEDSGGGSSDFEIATITVTVEDDAPDIGILVSIPQIMTEEAGAPFDVIVADSYSIVESSSFQTILYKGKLAAVIKLIESTAIAVSGDIEQLGGENYLITGDCTITLSLD